MQTQKKSNVLGSLEVALRGRQYCEALLLEGEPATLVREPDNGYDSHALRVENSGEMKVGYVPRRITSWLAPLLDAGCVGVSACGVGRDARAAAGAVALELRTLPPGEVLIAQHTPENALQAVHQTVLQAWRQAQACGEAAVVLETGRYLQALERQRLLPETRMLIALFPGMAATLRREAAAGAAQVARAALGALEWATPIHFHNLTLFPLLGGNEETPPYLLLTDAIALGKAEVCEVSSQGSVPHLRLKNFSDRALLVPEGSLLVGAKQNRVANVTILAAAHAETLLPVSCVEQGRWQSVSETFAAQQFAPPRLRANKLQRMGVASNGKERLSDQGQVWFDVAECLRSADAESATDSLTAAFQKTRERRAQYEQELRLPAAVVGVLAVSGEKVLGVDLFDCAQSFASLWPRLSEGYYLEASRSPSGCAPAAMEGAQAFLARVGRGIVPVAQPVGMGSEFQVRDRGLTGSALVYAGRLCHLAAFSCE